MGAGSPPPSSRTQEVRLREPLPGVSPAPTGAGAPVPVTGPASASQSEPPGAGAGKSVLVPLRDQGVHQAGPGCPRAKPRRDTGNTVGVEGLKHVAPCARRPPASGRPRPWDDWAAGEVKAFGTGSLMASSGAIPVTWLRPGTMDRARSSGPPTALTSREAPGDSASRGLGHVGTRARPWALLLLASERNHRP